jgi:hypothetical protein
MEVEKLLKADFIYLVPLTDWVSNIVLVTKKQCMIHICIDYRDINRSCLKDKYRSPFIDQIIDDCADSEIFSFMDGFFGYNQINILPSDQHKNYFICPWGNFSYKKLPFGLKNAGATFQWAIYYAFHYIKHIVQTYIDDLLAHVTLTRMGGMGTLLLLYTILLNGPRRCLHLTIPGKLQLFFFNHIITQFSVPQAIVTNHGTHFLNYMMS